MFYFLTLFNEIQQNYSDVKMFYFLTLFNEIQQNYSDVKSFIFLLYLMNCNIII